jgi:hypothetical protein
MSEKILTREETIDYFKNTTTKQYLKDRKYPDYIYTLIVEPIQQRLGLEDSVTNVLIDFADYNDIPREKWEDLANDFSANNITMVEQAIEHSVRNGKHIVESINGKENLLDFTKIDKRIGHLSHEDIERLIQRYFNGESVTKLLKEYNIKITASQLYTVFPPMISGEECTNCGSNMVYPWGSKTWGDNPRKQQIYCNECGHIKSSACSCDACKLAKKLAREAEIEKQKQLLANKIEIIKAHFAEDNWELFAEEDLSLEDQVFLSVILRGALAENTEYIEPLQTKLGKLAPSIDFEVEMIKHLEAREIIIPHVSSDPSAFELKEDGDTVSYKIFGVKYRINIQPSDLDYDAMIKRLMYPNPENFKEDKEFCLEMWKKIALNESLQYLLYQMKKVGYSFNPGEKTIRVFENLLEHFSVSQIYGIIYRAVANSTKRYQSGEVTKIHAQNSVISSCEGHGERALAQGWKLSHYSRLRDLPEPIISKVFFTSILQIAELGFSEKPTINF